MKTITGILFGVLMASALIAQDADKNVDAPWQQRVFVLKYADANAVAHVLSVFGATVQSDRNMHVVAVGAPPLVMPAVEEAIKRLDVPSSAPKDIDLVVYMVAASQQSAMDGTLPAELEPVTAELKRILAYKSFHLLDSIRLRTQLNNRAETNGVVAVPNGVGERPYSFVVDPISVTDDPNGRLIRLDQLMLTLHMPGDHQAGIRTEITVREGQKVVVGKSNMGTDQALVLVLTAKVIE